MRPISLGDVAVVSAISVLRSAVGPHARFARSSGNAASGRRAGHLESVPPAMEVVPVAKPADGENPRQD